jgi:hypothetical protein
MRRALGFKLTTQGRHLMSFVGFCEERGADGVTADLALAWATRTARGSSDEVYQARRLGLVGVWVRRAGRSAPPEAQRFIYREPSMATASNLE